MQGIVAARQELTALGRGDVTLGFSYAYRYLPSSDDQFWTGIAQRATPAFRRALDYVIAAQHPTQGGWRYQPRDPAGDTSVTGWQVLALASGRRAGFEVPEETWQLVFTDELGQMLLDDHVVQIVTFDVV